MRVLITGATGAVGPSVVREALEAGYRVRTLSLDLPQDDSWTKDVDMRLGDVTDLSAVQSAMEGVDGVIHLAALLHVVNPPDSLRGEYERVNVGGTATVTKAASLAKVGRMVFFSTIAVYGDTAGSIATEDSPLHPDTFYARTKREAEKAVLEAGNSHGRPMGTVLRMGAIYGARIKGNYERLVHALATGRFIPIGNGENRRTLIHEKDVARAAVLALFHPSSAGNVYNVSDGCYHSMNEIIASICSALGRPRPCFRLPVGPVRKIAGIIEDGAGVLGMKAPVVRATIDKYTEDMAVSSERIRLQLGFTPRFDLASGWAETIEQMRQRKDV